MSGLDDDVPMHDAADHNEPTDGDDDHDGQAGPSTQFPSTQFRPHHIPTEEELDEKYPNRPKNPNSTLPFHSLYTDLFEPLLSNKKKMGVGGRGMKNLKPHEIRRQIIDRFIARWRTEVGPDVYPAFRLIMPDKDRDRTVYGLKEKTIGKILVRLMKINKNSEDAQALINWKLPGVRSASTGDFAGRCYEIIKKRPMRTTPGNLTIAEVNKKLDELSAYNKEEQQLPIFNEFYNQMNAEELMWIVRIILKQMKVGATEKTFFQAWHPDAENLFNVSSSLKRVCWELHDPHFRLDTSDKGVLLMSCFQPQLAQFQKRSLDDAVKAMRRGAETETPEFWIEEKLDGERMQIHMKDGEFKFWSRKAKDYTYLYGENFEEGSLTRYLKEAFDPGVRNIILDGEMITWDPDLDCIVAFGTLKSACLSQARNPFDTTCQRPLFRVFDILYLNNECLINYTLADRRHALEASIRPIHRRLEIHNYTPATTAQEIEESLRKVVAEASEGLVIKNPRSMYRLNDRNDDWMKVKPDYMTEFGEDLDCCIIGGYYGSGRRGGILSSFLCGLRVDGNFLKPGDPENKFWSFCKVGGGLTAADYLKIQHITDAKWVKWDSRHPPKHIIELAGGPLQYEKPDEWIQPEDSVVIAVKAASVAATDQFRMGKTLRFPRFKSFREDKDWRSALSVTEFLNLKAKAETEANNKLNVEKRTRRVGAAGVGGRKKREVVVIGQEGAGKETETVKTQYAGPETMVFSGMAFFIATEAVSGNERRSKNEIEQLVKVNGGKFYQSEQAAPGIRVIGDRKTVKVSALIKNGNYDIIRPSWIFDSLRQYTVDKESGNIPDSPPDGSSFVLPLEPNYLLHATPKTAEEAKRNIDEFGDSYCRNVTVEEIGKLLQEMPSEGLDLGRAGELRQVIFHGGSKRTINGETQGLGVDVEELTALPGWTLARCVVYLDKPELAVGNGLVDPAAEEEPRGSKPKAWGLDVAKVDLEVAEQLLLFAGARVTTKFHERAVTHVVVSKADLARVMRIRESIAFRMEEIGGEEDEDEYGLGRWGVPRVVETGWVEECVRERTWVDEGRWGI
ncbi:ATP dependent DNA ligase domain-containing protein [Kalaharituber pfeilii]|nr:ATP dependent DNA ligase domain-containing protein [Kalaharituber pfeilii]